MSQFILCLYYLVALVAAYILLKAYRKQSSIGDKIGRVMLATFLIIIFYSFNFLTDYYRIMSLGNSLSFIMLDFLLLYFYDYTLEYLEYQDSVPGIVRKLIISYMAIDSFLLMLNIFFETAAGYTKTEFYDITILTVVPKTMYHFHVIYLCCVFFVIIYLIIKKMAESPGSYRKRYYGLLAVLILAFLANAVHFNGFFQLKINISIIVYGVLGIWMYFITFQYDTFIKQNIIRSQMFHYLSEPVVLFDYEGKLSETNGEVAKILPSRCLKQKLDIHIFLFESQITEIKDIHVSQTLQCTFEVEGKERNYDCHFDCMKDEAGRAVGYMFLFHDMTSIHEAYYALEQSIEYDALTGLFNTQSFYTQFPQWEDNRYWPVSVCVCNIDSLKKLNRECGVLYGDGLIKKLAACVKQYVGSNTFIAKVDDGNIVAMLENTEASDAATIFENIKYDFSKLEPDKQISIEYAITMIDGNENSARNAFEEAKGSMRRKKMLKNASASSSLVESLKQALCESDFQTEEHVERTQKMAARLGREMNLSDTEIGKLELLAILHDIGKVAIPQHVLKKRGGLTPEERHIIEQHTVKGYRIAKSSPELEEIAEGILSHHEKWDGTGYPNGLAGEEIPLLARIISAVDSHDVMVNDRPYHKAMPEEDAIEELKRCAGTQFDPNVVQAFVNLLEREELVR